MVRAGPYPGGGGYAWVSVTPKCLVFHNFLAGSCPRPPSPITGWSFCNPPFSGSECGSVREVSMLENSVLFIVNVIQWFDSQMDLKYFYIMFHVH